MLTLYFSGTGNSKYVARLFAENMSGACHSIEDAVDFAHLITEHDVIAFCYPIYMSRVPRIMRQFVRRHMAVLKGKKIIVFCTQLLLSGDGTRAFSALFPKNHVRVLYTEHFFMPNNVNNVPFFPIPTEKNIAKCKENARKKMDKVCTKIRQGKRQFRGFGPFSQLLGLPQGVFLSSTEKMANKRLYISDDCTGCGVCVKVCPMENLAFCEGKIAHNQDCTMCFRCLNKCPEKAMNVFFKGSVKGQYRGIE
ncbi:MAG: EFR1 family ferrodoxin [Oscillospiraceae bacterium]|nr:EFR1 family ferrodoxin [Oscillospiraceae bacterium]